MLNIYPHFKKIKNKNITKSDGFYDILFLGGSVLYDVTRHPLTREILQNHLQSSVQQPIRIFQAAYPGKSSRDNYFKYHYLQEKI